MPVHLGKDKEGCFAQWGGKGAKYYYECDDEKAQGMAKAKAYRQGFAATGGKMEEGFVLEQFEPPEAGDAPKGMKDIMRGVYNSCRMAWVKDHPDDKENEGSKESCSKQAWGAVKSAGWKKGKTGWTKPAREAFRVLTTNL